MGNVIAGAEEVTPEWLAAILREKGALARGRVTRVTPDETESTFASSVSRLEVGYTEDASPGAPRRLILKASSPALAPGEFDPAQTGREYIFYRHVAPMMRAAFTIPCYDAGHEPESGATHILLKDVSETHAACRDPLCGGNCKAAIDALASLHAFWWDHPRLGKDVGKFPTLEERREGWAYATESTVAFMAACGDPLAPAWRATYESVLPALPALSGRHTSGRHLTLVHGDAHLGNFLFPREAHGVPTYLIDWQFWHPTIGGTDLAFMMATSWDPAIRRRLEPGLMQRYYRGLLAGGVRGYAWDDCWDDYRLSVILVSIFIPVWRWALFHWEPDMRALAVSMTAFEDLRCAELLTVS